MSSTWPPEYRGHISGQELAQHHEQSKESFPIAFFIEFINCVTLNKNQRQILRDRGIHSSRKPIGEGGNKICTEEKFVKIN